MRGFSEPSTREAAHTVSHHFGGAGRSHIFLPDAFPSAQDRRTDGDLPRICRRARTSTGNDHKVNSCDLDAQNEQSSLRGTRDSSWGCLLIAIDRRLHSQDATRSNPALSDPILPRPASFPAYASTAAPNTGHDLEARTHGRQGRIDPDFRPNKEDPATIQLVRIGPRKRWRLRSRSSRHP
jgi:hypothetical protein